MSKVLVIGAGGVGSVAVHKMAMNADIFGEIHLASRTKAKCDAIAASVKATEPLLAWLDEHLAQRAFMGGDAPGMADFPIACELHRWFGLPQPRPQGRSAAK